MKSLDLIKIDIDNFIYYLRDCKTTDPEESIRFLESLEQDIAGMKGQLLVSAKQELIKSLEILR